MRYLQVFMNKIYRLYYVFIYTFYIELMKKKKKKNLSKLQSSNYYSVETSRWPELNRQLYLRAEYSRHIGSLNVG